METLLTTADMLLIGSYSSLGLVLQKLNAKEMSEGKWSRWKLRKYMFRRTIWSRALTVSPRQLIILAVHRATETIVLGWALMY